MSDTMSPASPVIDDGSTGGGGQMRLLLVVGGAALLLVLSGLLTGVRVSDGLIFAVAQTFIVSAILALILTRGRHLSWVVFTLIAALCLLALR